ncbi:hypothetical protein CR513_60928, partial [Mucuna pruriens]
MDRSSFSYGTRKSRPKSDIYSTFVVHDDDDDNDDGETNRRRKAGAAQPQDDLYATMVYKDNGHDDDEDSSLPPLLQRLPKDFGGGASLDYDDDDDDDEDAGDFGTVIVKSDRSRQRERPSSGLASPAWKARSSSQANSLNRFGGGGDGDGGDENDGGGFSTFVVRSTVKPVERESVSGTMVRRTAGGSGGVVVVGSTMERAVASMQAMGEFGLGKQRKGSGSLQNDEGRHQSMAKVSSSSIPESVIREDPTTKYELLNELGRAIRAC